jgi:SAM-dependent methyltransferase
MVTANPDERGVERADATAMVDSSRASIARVYDAILGGKDNYAVDRQVVDDVLRIAPESPLVAKALRRWLVRVVRYLARSGVDQFLDCGSGLPTAENTHQVAQFHNPEATVVYVDIDPIVAAHGRALLEENDRTHVVRADLTRPRELLASPGVARHLDFDRPVALIQCASLHHVDDEHEPAKIMAEYVDALCPGSYVALTHWLDPEDGGEGTALARRKEAAYRNSSMGTGRYRTRGEIMAMLDGLELLEPGLVELDQWWPGGPALTPPSLVERLILGAVGRKP